MKSYLKTHAYQLAAVFAIAAAMLLGFMPAEVSAMPLMALATFDVTDQVAQGRAQNSRRVELHYRIPFATIFDGTGLAATETAKLCTLPAGYVHERLDAILRTAEGEAATLDIGISGDADGFLDGGNLNGTPNAKVALAGTETITPGTYFHTNTDVEILCPAAANTINVAVLDVTFVGYLVDTGTEK